MHIDIFIESDGIAYGIELKYKTKYANYEILGEKYSLKEHSAHDCARYDYIYDIMRLERLINEKKIDIGYAIMLTNEKLFGSDSGRNSVDKEFLISNDKIVGGIMKWSKEASEGTKKGREGNLKLSNSYKMEWAKFSEIANEEDHEDIDIFKYNCVEIIG